MKKISILFSVISVLVATSCSKKESEPKVKEYTESIPVKLTNIKQQSVTPNIASYGIVTTHEDIKASFNTHGRIKRMYAKEGESVKKGQIIAELDVTEMRTQVNQSNESYSQAVRDFKRVQNLYADSVATLEQFENAKTAMRIAKEALDMTTYNQSYTIIKAPANGVIIQKINNEGEFVAAGTPIYILSSEQNNEFIIKVSVTAQDRSLICVGDKAEIQLEGMAGAKVLGTVKQIAQNVDYASGLYIVEILITHATEKVSIGLFGKVNIIPDRQVTYYTLPLECLTEGYGTSGFIYIPKDDNKVGKVKLEVDLIQDGVIYFKNKPNNITQVVKEGAGFLSQNSTISIK